MGRAAWVALGLMGACKPVREAPTDVDAALRGLWTAYHDEDGEALAVVVDAIPTLVDVDALAAESAWVDGQQGPLTLEEMALAEGSEMVPEPEEAVALFTVSRYPCAMDHQQKILVYHDQNELYEVYDGYVRSYIDDAAAFLAGGAAGAEWRGDIEATIPTVGSYSYGFRTGIRRVEGASVPAVVTRTFMERVAQWDNENATFEQDYQIEAYLDVGGDIVHFYGVWRDMVVGWMGDMTTTPVARTTVNQMFKWDRRTAALCAEGTPAQSP